MAENIHLDPGRLESLNESGLELPDPSHDVRERKVFDSHKRHIGKVDDLLIDVPDRKVRFLHVSAGGFLGIGSGRFLVPVDEVADVTSDAVNLKSGAERIAAAPDYESESVDSDRRLYWGGVYNFWGYSPYWSPGYIYPLFPYYDHGPETHLSERDSEDYRGD